MVSSYIKIITPGVGSFVSFPINLSAEINSASGINRINIYFNGQLVGNSSGNFGNSYQLNWSFSPSRLGPQNLIEIEILDSQNRQIKSEVIVYH